MTDILSVLARKLIVQLLKAADETDKGIKLLCFASARTDQIWYGPRKYSSSGQKRTRDARVNEVCPERRGVTGQWRPRGGRHTQPPSRGSYILLYKGSPPPLICRERVQGCAP